MKIIVLRNQGFARSVSISRRVGLGLLAGAMLLSLIGGGWVVSVLRTDQVDAEVVARWRAKLADQHAEVLALEQKASAQSAAVGKQLAQMQARLLRMEALGAHMSEAANLGDEEFDFDAPPAQGGPVDTGQHTLPWQDLQQQLGQLSQQLKRRQTELSILDSVLVNQDISDSSEVKGRPVTWGWMSSPYGRRVDPLTGKTAWHAGVDFAGREGSNVIAVASGVVTFAGTRYGYGNLVEISHADGLVTRYAHHKTLLVKTGDVVKKGEPIGTMGSTGRSTGPHVHFEVLRNGRSVDPAKYVAKRS